jgi:hypothetical protein
MTPVNIGERSRPADDVVGAAVGMGDPAGHLARMLAAVADEGKHRHRIVPGLFLQQRIVDAAAVERGGVPVLRRPTGSWISFRRSASEIAAGSPKRGRPGSSRGRHGPGH